MSEPTEKAGLQLASSSSHESKGPSSSSPESRGIGGGYSGDISVAGSHGSDIAEHLELEVVRQPPACFFENEVVDVSLKLNDLSGDYVAHNGTPGGGAIEFILELHGHESVGAVPEPLDSSVATLTATPKSMRLRIPGRNKETGRMEELPATHVRCEVAVHASRKKAPACYSIKIMPRNPAKYRVVPIFTETMKVVQYKIFIPPSMEWETIWYKDEGGRDKAIQVLAELQGRDGTLVTGRRVPIQLTLVYETDHRAPLKVLKQDILRSLGAPRQCIDQATGQTVVRFRVDDVSKNHQGQNFVLEVAPADGLDERFPDIGPGYTPPVNIRSKRNKRHRSSGTPKPTTPSATAEFQPNPGPPELYPRSVGNKSHSQHQEGLRGVSDVGKLREAMKGVISWTEEVVNGLHPLQWQHIGYAQFPDGSADYSRPNYSMSNPNACISKILSMYSETTRDQLQDLLSAVENTQKQGQTQEVNPGGGSARYAPMMPSVGAGDNPADAPPAATTRHPEPYGYDMHQPVPPQHMPYTNAPTHLSEPYPGRRPPPQAAYADQAIGRPSGNRQQQPHHLTHHYPPQHYPQYPSHQQQHMLANQSQQPLESPERVNNLYPLPVHGGASPHGHGAVAQSDAQQRSVSQVAVGGRNEDSREAEVEFVMAIQYKGARTGDVLGFPAYTGSREIVGFYRESSMKVGVGQFIPISVLRDEFGPMELQHAKRILIEAIENGNRAVHSLKDWGSIANLVDHALVYDWSKNLGGNNGSNSGSGSAGDPEVTL
eukprot:CAMPEP_0198296388 /NCGR_PEP_ID=MMETSP1449-20131203/32261_1 /TAXON_ID=420275 /ORGANISM="Attheya septentrionalis, Strain CCMP2084" /LENGTH=770 /DNA_ID=CAMNT_0043996991 /DNA_START=353 /DNA_END=2665 /DNA_ORIENTATION=+